MPAAPPTGQRRSRSAPGGMTGAGAGAGKAWGGKGGDVARGGRHRPSSPSPVARAATEAPRTPGVQASEHRPGGRTAQAPTGTEADEGPGRRPPVPVAGGRGGDKSGEASDTNPRRSPSSRTDRQGPDKAPRTPRVLGGDPRPSERTARVPTGHRQHRPLRTAITGQCGRYRNGSGEGGAAATRAPGFRAATTGTGGPMAGTADIAAGAATAPGLGRRSPFAGSAHGGEVRNRRGRMSKHRRIVCSYADLLD